MGAFNQPSLSAAQGFPRPTMPAGQRTAQLDARAGEARPKGESRERPEESLLSSGRFRLSPALRGSVTPSSFISAAFPSTTQVLCFFLDARKKRNPSSPCPLAPSCLNTRSCSGFPPSRAESRSGGGWRRACCAFQCRSFHGGSECRYAPAGRCWRCDPRCAPCCGCWPCTRARRTG